MENITLSPEELNMLKIINQKIVNEYLEIDFTQPIADQQMQKLIAQTINVFPILKTFIRYELNG